MHNHVKDIKTKNDTIIKIIYNTSREEIHNIRVVGVQVKPAHLLVIMVIIIILVNMVIIIITAIMEMDMVLIIIMILVVIIIIIVIKIITVIVVIMDMVTVLIVMVIRDNIMATNVTMILTSIMVIKAIKVTKNANCKSVELGNSEIHLSQALLLVQVLGMMGMIDQER